MKICVTGSSMALKIVKYIENHRIVFCKVQTK